MHRLSTADRDFEPRFTALLATARETTARVDQVVADILSQIRTRGDDALIELTARFDGMTLTPDRLRVTKAEADEAVAAVPSELSDALRFAASRIEAFHRAQKPTDLRITDPQGLTLGMRWTPLDSSASTSPEARRRTRHRS